ncbi:hypothetical protein DXG01_007966 [Tephrocybe rancida]|nr:hypothetical protein DXG01_007966 [Tephrocybe rancida]
MDYGWVYFFSESLKVVTDQDIRDPELYALVNHSTSKYPLPDLDVHMEVQIIVHMGGKGEDSIANLFLVINHKECVASYDLKEVKDENVPLLDPNTLNRRRRLYWNYLWNHPVHVPTPARAIPDASDALTWYFTDNLISGSKSLAPFSKSECEDLTQVLHQMSEPYNNGSVAKTVFVAWLLRESTVLLGATVALLAINDIDEPAKVGATVSALASLGSIIVGVFSIWRHQTNTRTADSVSTPLWAILTFTVSVVAYAMQGITGVGTLHPASVWAIVGIFIVLLGAVIAALYTFSIIWTFQRKSWRLAHWKALWNKRRARNNNPEL